MNRFVFPSLACRVQLPLTLEEDERMAHNVKLVERVVKKLKAWWIEEHGGSIVLCTACVPFVFNFSLSSKFTAENKCFYKILRKTEKRSRQCF